MANDYVLGAGKVYIDILDANDNPTGERYLGNTPGFAVQMSSESLEKFGNDAAVEELEAFVMRRIDRAATLQVDNIDADNLALFYHADKQTVTGPGGSVSAEAHTVKQGHYYQLKGANANPSGARDVSSVTVTGTGGTPSYTVTDDYTVDEALGRIYIVPGGGISDDTDIEVNYTDGSTSREQVKTKSVSAVHVALRFIADNREGTNRDLYAPKVRMTPEGEDPWKGEDWRVLPFTLRFLKKDDSTEVLYIDGRAA